jgi:oxygen-dependent protoporphyrinogen oxidase
MIARVTSDLRDLIGVKGAPLFTTVTRWPQSMPQYEIGHLQRVQQIKQELESLTNVRMTGNAFDGPGIPDCIRNGETAADELLKAIDESATS